MRIHNISVIAGITNNLVAANRMTTCNCYIYKELLTSVTDEMHSYISLSKIVLNTVRDVTGQR